MMQFEAWGPWGRIPFEAGSKSEANAIAGRLIAEQAAAKAAETARWRARATPEMLAASDRNAARIEAYAQALTAHQCWIPGPGTGPQPPCPDYPMLESIPEVNPQAVDATPTQGAVMDETPEHTFSLIPGETVHIGGIPYFVTGDGRLTGANDPVWARGLRDQRSGVGSTGAPEKQ